MKLRKEIVEVRENFARRLFEGAPNLSVAAANRMVRERFGSTIRAQRMYQLRDAARKL